MKNKKEVFKKIIGFSMACCMLTNLAVPVSFAEETKKEPTYMRMDHPLKEENNWIFLKFCSIFAWYVVKLSGIL